MSHVFLIPDEIYDKIATYAAQRGQTPDALLLTLLTEVTERVELLEQGQLTAHKGHEAAYDRTRDPLAPFIGMFDSGGNDLGWIERHDEYFAADAVHGGQNGKQE
jgi:hypothetical protein